MKLGAHVSASGGVSKSIDRALDIGAEAIQIFASSPRAWKFNHPKPEEVERFRKKSEESGIGPCYIHGSYLVNIGGSEDQLQKSIDCLVNNMSAAGEIGAEGVIFHGGSHKGKGFDAVLNQAANCLTQVLEKSPDNVWLCLENSAGMGAHIGSSFREIGRILRVVDHPNLKVCLDTEHCFAAGYNLAVPEELDKVIAEFDSEIGLDKLVAVHANDAKVELGSGVDRHENIGEGYIGISGFESILGNTAFKNVPFFLEVPGFDGNGPDKENLDRLKTIRSSIYDE
ncbi:MAG: putative endonuclease 4 [Chloroflexota bacterium]|nr:MAG: putative endonuclease 4 [Chloroflexota bacterium]